MTEYCDRLNQNSDSEVSRLNAFRDNTKMTSEQQSSYDKTSAVPDSDSMYEHTYRQHCGEQLYVDTHNHSDEKTDTNSAMTQRLSCSHQFQLKLKPSVSREEEAFSFRRSSIRNEPKYNKYLKKYGVPGYN